MQVICLQNMIYGGRRYTAGQSVDISDEYVDALQFAGLVYIEPDIEETLEASQVQSDVRLANKTASKRGRKAVKK